MRLDLGLLQMEMTGRPDGAKPHGYDSLLEYFEAQLKEHEETNGTRAGLPPHAATQCQSLREEAVHVLPALPEPVRAGRIPRRRARHRAEPARAGPVRQVRVEEQDRLVLEQYRPYIT